MRSKVGVLLTERNPHGLQRHGIQRRPLIFHRANLVGLSRRCVALWWLLSPQEPKSSQRCREEPATGSTRFSTPKRQDSLVPALLGARTTEQRTSDSSN